MPPRLGEIYPDYLWFQSSDGRNFKLENIKDINFEEDKKMKHEGKILIMVDEGNDNKVIARDLKTGDQAEAVCCPKDEWDFYTGAKLALRRLTEKQWSGKVVCVEDRNAGTFFFKGKVYTVKNGVIYDEHTNYGNEFIVTSVEDLNVKMREFGKKNYDRAWAQFIEYKGGAEE